MKNKVKSFSMAVSVVLMTVPGLVLAVYTEPANTGLPSGSIFNIIQNIMNWMLGIIGILGVIGFAIAGVLYLTAAGDDTRIQQAKSAMMYSIIGVIVALAGLVALKAAQGLLGASSNF